MELLKNGDKFWRLTVVKATDKRLQRSIVYECACDCGNIVYTTRTRLVKGLTKSCGCLQKERASELNKKHGMSNTKLFNIWQDMCKRCFYENHHAYNYYGGRGITVCNEWKNDFLSFYNWSISNGYKEGLSIDRINNNGNYCPENCRWTTMKIQSSNRRIPDLSFSKNPNAKGVAKYTLDNTFIKSYPTIKEACIDNNIKGTGTCISACCRGKQKQAYGFVWKYITNKE